MRFFATYRINQQPRLTGCTTDTIFEDYHNTSCHKFTVTNVEVDMKEKVDYCIAAANVTLVAGKYPDSSLHGPASLLKDRTLIYTCDKFRCRLGCPCHLCRKKINNCSKSGDKETCGEDCDKCRADCYDHLLFHRALHLGCKFCANLLEHIPNVSFVIRQVRGYLPDLYEERLSASLFEHRYKDITPIQLQPSNMFTCDKCEGNS